MSRLSCGFVFFCRRENIDWAGENRSDWGSYLRWLKRKIIKQICSHMYFSLSLLQKIRTYLFIFCDCGSFYRKRQQWIFISSITICLYFHAPAYLEKCFENKDVCYDPFLDADLWKCKVYLLPLFSFRPLLRDHMSPVGFQAGWGSYCNAFLMLQIQRKLEKTTLSTGIPVRK